MPIAVLDTYFDSTVYSDLAHGPQAPEMLGCSLWSVRFGAFSPAVWSRSCRLRESVILATDSINHSDTDQLSWSIFIASQQNIRVPSRRIHLSALPAKCSDQATS